ncbi:hypothetical protein E3P77_03327 [Wallemia ichthyophaga]|nr:hypothetical protein E3P96_02159 [Wallemia ichthyophaga]TIB58911.1 hypothetical protein E3P78_03738 [Wallemia ichthyophaga]TIB63993.1 hypothetical protein E3P77_03327 [Wallemia ichthyophaga]
MPLLRFKALNSDFKFIYILPDTVNLQSARKLNDDLKDEVMKLKIDNTRHILMIASNEKEIYASDGNDSLLFTLEDFDEATERHDYCEKKKLLLPDHRLEWLDTSLALSLYEKEKNTSFWSPRSHYLPDGAREELMEKEVLALENEQNKKEDAMMRKIVRTIIEKFGRDCTIVLDELRPFGFRYTEYPNISLCLLLDEENLPNFPKSHPISISAVFEGMGVNAKSIQSKCATSICYVCGGKAEQPVRQTTAFPPMLSKEEQIPIAMSREFYCKHAHHDVNGISEKPDNYYPSDCYPGTFLKRTVNVVENIRKKLS